MKKLILTVFAVCVMVSPVFAESPGESIINHNEVFVGHDLNKKIDFLFIDRIAIQTRKTLYVNAFGNEFDPTPIDKGWYGGIVFKTDLN
jgi:hypothetical protein